MREVSLGQPESRDAGLEAQEAAQRASEGTRTVCVPVRR
jgi:hypothetical protein